MAIKWLVKLSGAKGDLQELPEYFSVPECRVVVEGDGYYLKSNRFNSLTEVNDVEKESEALVRMINGLAKLKLSNWWEVKIASLVHIEES